MMAVIWYHHQLPIPLNAVLNDSYLTERKPQSISTVEENENVLVRSNFEETWRDLAGQIGLLLVSTVTFLDPVNRFPTGFFSIMQISNWDPVALLFNFLVMKMLKE